VAGAVGAVEENRPVGIWAAALIVWEIHHRERTRINDIKAQYREEVMKDCGPKPPHP
jgi:hypothetical protein